MLANMALAKGHSSKTKSQVSDIRTIDPLVFLSFLFVCLLAYKRYKPLSHKDGIVTAITYVQRSRKVGTPWCAQYDRK